MFSAAEVAELQADAESMMGDTFRAFAPTARAKNAAGYESQAYAAQGDTVGKVQSRSSGSGAGSDVSSRSVDIGGVIRPVLEGGLHIPLSAPVPVAGPVGTGWEYECIAVGPLSDPTLMGRRYLVVGVPAKSYPTARRLDVVQL